MITTTQMTWSFLLGAMNTVSSSPFAACLSLILFVTCAKPFTVIAKGIFIWGAREFSLPATDCHIWHLPGMLNPCRIHSDQELFVQVSQIGRYPVRAQVFWEWSEINRWEVRTFHPLPPVCEGSPKPWEFCRLSQFVGSCCSTRLWSQPGGSGHQNAFWKQHLDHLPVRLDVVNLTHY